MANSFETDWEKPELETLASLAQHLVYRLPECDDAVVRLTLREVYRDFCRRSCCLRVRRRFEHAVHGDYIVPTMFGGEVYRVTEVCEGVRPLREGRDYTVNGNVVHLHRRHPLVVAYPPPPPYAAMPYQPELRHGRIACFVSISWIELPALSTENAPRWLVERHGDSLCAGALARLMMQANKPWSDPQMAMVEGNRYEAAVNEECQRLYAASDSGAQGSLFDTSDLI